jgi:2-oxo-3-hexenedioate decarboxylase
MQPILDLRALALEMKTAQDSVRQIRPFTDRLPTFDLPAAYEVANLIHHARVAEGAKPVGRKIGFTNSDMWCKFGVREPIWAYIYDTTVFQLKDTATTCQLSHFAEPKIEPEIVLHFHTAPQVEGGRRGIIDAIDWVAHGFEIVQSHFPGWKFQAPDTVADQGLHGTLLIGPPLTLAQLGNDPVAALASFSLTLSCDGRHIETGKGSNVLGNPLSAIAHLISVLAKQAPCAPLQAGEIVTTGTITTAQSVYAGETWQSELDGVALSGLEVAFSK